MTPSSWLRFFSPRTLSAVFVALSLLVSSTGWAGESTDFVKENQGKLFDVVAQPKTDARQKKLRGMFDEMLAYKIIARVSLGKKAWNDLSAEQKETFTSLLTKIVRANYQRNLTKMLDYRIVYEREVKDGPTMMVHTLAKHKTDEREPDIEVDFRLKKLANGWRIVDIHTERASLVKTYRSQFLKIMRKDGFDKLIEKMQTKLDKMNEKS